MTWEELQKKINEMDEEQKQTDVTIYDESIAEFFRVREIRFCDPNWCDVLDPNHPFLIYNPANGE